MRDEKPVEGRLVSVTKQPTLTGFPRTVFATAKRRLQATLRRARQQSIRQSLCGYALMFSDLLPASFLQSIDPTRRQRHFGHLPVFWAWVAQILEANSSCANAVALIQAWCRTAGLSCPASGTGGYCQARGRIHEDFLHSVFEKINEGLNRRIRPEDLWCGHVVKAIDGSSVTLMDTSTNQYSFPQPGGQLPGCGFPTMGIVGVLNLSHGGWEGFEACPHQDHDSIMAPKLLKHIQPGDLLLGDRAFCTYEFIVRLQAQGASAVMRLHQARHAKLDWRKGKKISPMERLVVWKKPVRQPAGSQLSREQWQGLPEELQVRYIKLGYEDRCGQKRALVVVTTLLDTRKYDALEVSGLYAKRWGIELKLRDIKTTLGMENFEVRSPAMAAKTLWMMLIASNLLRGLIQQSAIEADEPLSRVSCKGVLDQALASAAGYLRHRGKPRVLTAHHASVIETCATKLLAVRPFRREPRAVKRRPKGYPHLTAPRELYEEIPHRGRNRRAA